jgi:hypothetical protein
MTISRDEDLERPVMIITEVGLRALKDDTQLSDDHRLSIEIMSRCSKGLTGIELDSLINGLVAHRGSAAAAIEAIKLGYTEIREPK